MAKPNAVPRKPGSKMWVLEPESADLSQILLFGGAPTTVGRGLDCTLRLPQDETAASRRHCEFEIRPDYELSNLLSTPRVIMTDVSRFGTFVNRTRCEAKRALELSEGTAIHFGRVSPRTGFVLRRRPLVFCFSRVPRSERAELSKAVRRLGGHLVGSWSDACTHLVTPEISATQKVLLALIDGRPCVKPQWIRDTLSANDRSAPPSESDYRPAAAGAVLDAVRFSQSQGLAEEIVFSPRKGLLSGKAFVFINCTEKSFGGSGSCALARRTGAEVHWLRSPQPREFWQKIPPFLVIDAELRAEGARPTAEILQPHRELFPPQVYDSLVRQSSVWPQNVISSSVLANKLTTPEDSFCDAASALNAAPPDAKMAGEDDALRAPGLGKRRPSHRNTQERELAELLSMDNGAGDAKSQPPQAVHADKSLIEWGAPAQILSIHPSQQSGISRLSRTGPVPSRRRSNRRKRRARGDIDDPPAVSAADAVVAQSERRPKRRRRAARRGAEADGPGKSQVDEVGAVADDSKVESATRGGERVEAQGDTSRRDAVKGAAVSRGWGRSRLPTRDGVSNGGRVSVQALRDHAKASGRIAHDDEEKSAGADEVRIDFDSAPPFRSRVISKQQDSQDNAGAAAESKSAGVGLEAEVVTPQPKAVALDPKKFNVETFVSAYRRREAAAGSSAGARRPQARGGANYKRFRGNKMAEKARRRAITRHVDFDITVHDAFLSDRWQEAAGRESNILENIDSLLDSNLRPEKRKPRKRKAAYRGKATASLSAKKGGSGGRKRKARR